MGYTEGIIFPLDGKMVYPLMVYSNEISNSISYEVYEKSTGHYYTIDMESTIPFTNDMIQGDALTPVMMALDTQISEFRLSSPYPNPFNPVVNFDLTLVGNNYVNARIYDITGKEVEVLYNEKISEGYKTLTWNASNHASGIYFLKVVIDGTQMLHEKIILLK